MRFDPKTWLARLAFSFFIIAAVLVWQAYKLSRADPQGSNARIALYSTAAAMCFILGAAGIRARHRRDQW